MKRIKPLSKLGDLNDTERIKTLICTSQVSEAYKQLLTDAYEYYVQYRGLTWIKPKFVREDKPIFLPLESELDALIANTKQKLSTFLQFLKETGCDSGEAWKLRWIDIGLKTVAITPTKNHLTRIIPISENLVARLFRLPRTDDRVFGNMDLDDYRNNYDRP